MTMFNARISINDLVEACRILGEVRVLAAGSMYATLECDEVSVRQLAKAEIDWYLD